MSILKMPRAHSGLPIVALLLGGHLWGASPQSANSPGISPERALLNQYCVTCHNERLKTAGLELDKVSVENVAAMPDVWEKVVRKVRTSQMPPNRMPRPDKAATETFVSYLET